MTHVLHCWRKIDVGHAFLGLKRLIKGMSDQCWNGYVAGEMKHVIGA